jgi:tripartite-type tricarboxylate transporter receptor subunit TctC
MVAAGAGQTGLDALQLWPEVQRWADELGFSQIGVADIERSPLQPDIPTFHEAGVKDLRSITWFGLVLPPKSSEAIAQKINRDVATILLRPEVAERIKGMNMTPGGGTPAQAAQFFREQTQMWATLIKSLNLELQ